MLNEVFASITFCNDLSKRDAALIYAQVAPVFPLKPNTKLPLLKGSWVQYATQDASIINQWWEQYPEANIAMVMGKQLLCSDLDMKDGDNGWESYQTLAPGQVLAPMQVTPSGGYHLIHQRHDGLINFTHKGSHGGLDLRTANGYIVVAPSTLPEGNYQWLQGGDVNPAPSAVLDAYSQWSTESTVDRDVELPELLNIDDLKPLSDLPLRQKFLDFLQTGEVHTDYEGDRSRALLGATAALYQLGLNDATVMTYLENAPGAIDCAQAHGGDRRSSLWLWKYNCLKARQNVTVREPETKVTAATAFSDVTVEPITEPSNETPLAPSESEKERFRRMAWDINPNDDEGAINLYAEAYRISPIFGDQIGGIIHQIAGIRKSDLEKYRKMIKKQQAQSIRQGDDLSARQSGEPLPYNHPANLPPKRELVTWADVVGRYVYISSENRWLDRLTRESMTTEALNIREAHTLNKLNEDVDDAAKLRMSDTLAIRHDTLKVDTRSYWPGITQDLIHIGNVDAVNTWQPSTLEIVEGDVGPWWGLFCHLFPDVDSQTRILDWMAFILQKPHIKINYALLIGGAPRIGKDSVFQPLIQGLGINNVNPGIKAEMLDEKYDDHFIGVKLAVIQEIHRDGFRDARSIENKLKIYLASPPDEITLRRLGATNVKQRNLIQILAFSNYYDDALHISANGDRYLCEWSPAVKLPPSEYQKVYDWYDKEQGYGKVVHFLLNRDLTHFNPKSAAPDTLWRKSMLASGKSDLEYEIEDIIDKVRQENANLLDAYHEAVANNTYKDSDYYKYHQVTLITPTQIQARLETKHPVTLKTIATVLADQGIPRLGGINNDRYRVPAIFVKDNFMGGAGGDKFRTTLRTQVYQIDGALVDDVNMDAVKLGLCPNYLIRDYLASLN